MCQHTLSMHTHTYTGWTMKTPSRRCAASEREIWIFYLPVNKSTECIAGVCVWVCVWVWRIRTRDKLTSGPSRLRLVTASPHSSDWKRLQDIWKSCCSRSKMKIVNSVLLINWRQIDSFSWGHFPEKCSPNGFATIQPDIRIKTWENLYLELSTRPERW